MDRRNFIKNAAVTGVAAAGLAELGTSALGRLFGGAAQGATDALQTSPLRPPGAIDEDDFVSTCIRCMRCSDACPNHAIVQLDDSFGRGRQSTPTIKPRRQACMLCQGVEGEYLKCTEACPSGALQKIRKNRTDIMEQVHIGTAKLDLALCYSYNNWSCGACYRACPLPGVAMTLGLWERPEVVADACIGCGLCERACIRYPQAIRVVPVRKSS